MTSSDSMTRFLIRGGQIYDHDEDIHQPAAADLLINGDIIERVEPTIAPIDGVEVINAAGKLLVPGFVNAHYHSHDVLAKGMFEDVPFDVWTLHANPGHFGRRSLKEIRLRTLIGAIENLRNGITTIQDMLTLVPQEEEYLDCVLSAYEEAGIRVVLSLATRDMAALDIAPFMPKDLPESIRRRIEGTDRTARGELDFVSGQIKRLGVNPTPLQTWALGPSAPQRCSPELLEGIGALSRKFGFPVLTHVYETRIQAAAAQHSSDPAASLLDHLTRAGMMNPQLSVVHGVWLSPRDIARIAETGARVVSNPISNLALKSGVAPILDLYRAGVDIAIGCDNYSCAQTQNIFVAMRMLCLLPSVMDPEPGSITAAHALKSATLSGARAVGLAGKVGALKPGMAADLMILDLSEPSFVPFNSAARQVVFAECGRAIETVFVRGRPVVRNGRMTTVDEMAIVAEAAELSPGLRRDAAAIASRNSDMITPILAASRDAWNVKLSFDRYIGRSKGH